METALSLQSCSWIGMEKVAGRSKRWVSEALRGLTNERRPQTARFGDLRKVGGTIWTAHVELKFSCSCNYRNNVIKPAGVEDREG